MPRCVGPLLLLPTRLLVRRSGSREGARFRDPTSGDGLLQSSSRQRFPLPSTSPPCANSRNCQVRSWCTSGIVRRLSIGLFVPATDPPFRGIAEFREDGSRPALPIAVLRQSRLSPLATARFRCRNTLQ